MIVNQVLLMRTSELVETKLNVINCIIGYIKNSDLQREMEECQAV